MGLAIRLARTERGISRKKLSELAGLSYPFLSAIESGTRRPSTRTLASVARALGVSVTSLVGAAEARSDLAEEAPSLERSFDASDSEPMLMHSYLTTDALAAPAAELRSSMRPTSLLRELSDLAERLRSEDLAFVVELARRLSR